METFVRHQKNFKCYTMVYGKPMYRERNIGRGYVLRFSREKCKIFVNYHTKVSYQFATLQ